MSLTQKVSEKARETKDAKTPPKDKCLLVYSFI